MRPAGLGNDRSEWAYLARLINSNHGPLDHPRTCTSPVLSHQIAPDGHCLFAAVADQLSIHGIIPRSAASYAATRATAAHHMMQHRDDFLPFLPSVDGEDGAGATESEGMMSQRDFQMYCASIRDTAAWGGEPEIMALSRAYNVPIHVVQAGKPPVVIHEPLPNMSDHLDAKIVFISYHRRMYGLGEVSGHPFMHSWSNTLNYVQPQHYNSLRPKSKLPNMIRSALR
jgi:OTU-like cysteine protease